MDGITDSRKDAAQMAGLVKVLVDYALTPEAQRDRAQLATQLAAHSPETIGAAVTAAVMQIFSNVSTPLVVDVANTLGSRIPPLVAQPSD